MGNPRNHGWMIGHAVMLLSVGLLLALISAGRAEAALHVSPAGVDSAACGTTALPCRNVDYAVHKAANGETVKVAGESTGTQMSSTCVPVFQSKASFV